MEIRKQLYGDEINGETASTLFNLGHLLQGIGGRVNTTAAIQYHEQALKMYQQLGQGKPLITKVVVVVEHFRSGVSSCESRR